MPPAALAKFRFRLVGHKSLSLVWTSKGSGSRFDLSVWAPDTDAFPLVRRARARLCVGHAAVDALEPPGRQGRPLPMVVEVVDSSVTLSSSEHLAAVVEQLFPRPLRYRLAWHSTQHKPPLYVWRATPPSGQFVALGMIATTSDEPPPPNAMCCVPRRWCEQQRAPARMIWRDDGQGGRPGSFWSVPTLELLVAGQNSDAPEEALTSWCLAEGRISTDTWLVSQ